MSEIKITSEIERVYSPESLCASIRGKNTRIVVKDDVKSGIASVPPVFLSAPSRSSPSSKRFLKSSAITIPLSTNRPRAIIRVAKDIRSKGILKKFMIDSVMRMTPGTIDPTISPVRSPKNIITTIKTMVRVWITFKLTP